MLSGKRHFLVWFALFFLAVAYVFCVDALSRHRMSSVQDEDLYVALPRPVQLILAGGDKYLAANINVFRAMMVSTQGVDQTTVAVQAQLQKDAALFNPWHEDNYYIAAATLAWQGEPAAAQEVLLKATEARVTDIYPPFFYGFNKQYFEGDYLGAAKAIEMAASRSAEPNKSALMAMAARWHEKAQDSDLALNTLRAMAKQARDPGLKRYIESRADRLMHLLELRRAAQRYQTQFGKPIRQLNDLIVGGVLPKLPEDPTGIGYSVDERGMPVLSNPSTKKR